MAKTIIENTPLELYVFDPEAGNIRYYTKSEIQVSASNNNVVLSNKGGGTPFFSKPLTEIDTPSTTPPNSLAEMVKLIHGWITSPGGTDNFSGGWADYEDTATAGTPISVSATPAVLTNDGLGVNTITKYLPTGANGVTQLWDTSSNGFDFSDLDVGDMVDIRMDINVIIASTNTVIDINLEMGAGGTVVVPFISDLNFKATGTFEIIRYNGVYIGSENVRDNLAQLKISADKACTCTVNGWYIKAIRRG